MTDSNLLAHARRELRLLGEEEWVVNGYLEMIEIFAKMGHSGGSASVFIPTLTRLLQFKNLRPLTNDPDEWNFISGRSYGLNEDLWQNKRNSEAFSTDNGATYYLLSDGRDEDGRPIKYHVSEDYRAKIDS